MHVQHVENILAYHTFEMFVCLKDWFNTEVKDQNHSNMYDIFEYSMSILFYFYQDYSNFFYFSYIFLQFYYEIYKCYKC
jgi:hypothetical protein